MSRWHAEPVEVRRQDDTPAQFLWRGRLYLVLEELARWTEAGGWWRDMKRASAGLPGGEPGTDARSDAGAADLLLDVTVPPSLRPGDARAGRFPADALPGTAAVPAAVISALLDDQVCEWWRVEAAAGMCAPRGVYDLCRSVTDGTWQLRRVLD